jgi:hypothetical protein
MIARLYCGWLGDGAIAVAWGLAGDEEAGGGCASVEGLMLLAGGDFEAFAGVEDDVVVVDFEGEFSFEDVEELTGVDVGVAGLAGVGWH